MEFVLTGFRQAENYRRYTYQAISPDRTRRDIVVAADLNLIHKYKIPLQELPLLCRRLLEAHADDPKADTLMFTEKDMVAYSEDRAVAAHADELKRRAHRTPVSNRSGQAWRSPQRVENGIK